jgi:ABC-type iron transport system FetAB permease component
MTVRGVLMALVPFAMTALGITEAVANEAVDLIVQFVFLFTALLSTVWTLYGLARKVYNRRWAAE